MTPAAEEEFKICVYSKTGEMLVTETFDTDADMRAAGRIIRAIGGPTTVTREHSANAPVNGKNDAAAI